MKTFEKLKTELEECRDNSDIESGHSLADDLLVVSLAMIKANTDIVNASWIG